MRMRAKLNRRTPSYELMTLIESGLASKGFNCVAGVDEAGRGPLAGPVVAAAVVFEHGRYPSGVRDSKLLTPRLREEAFLRICDKALSVGVGIVSQDAIDRINILKATHMAMMRAIFSLEKRPDFVLIDGIFAPGTGIPQKAVVGGDARSISVAAASIIAKVSRDRLMAEHDRRFPGYGFSRHKGYGTRDHIENLRRLGPCGIHRMSFRPVAEAAEEYRQSGKPANYPESE